jgi:hypothetical protein
LLLLKEGSELFVGARSSHVVALILPGWLAMFELLVAGATAIITAYGKNFRH